MPAQTKYDKVVTIAIGRNYGKNKSLTRGQWSGFKSKTKNLLNSHAQIVAATHGRGIGSDNEQNGKPENTFVLVAVNPVKIKQFQTQFKNLLSHYHQTSAAFAIDKKHKPIFSL